MVLNERLRNARLHRFPLGPHEVHEKYPSQFVKHVQDHILKPKDYNSDDSGDSGNHMGVQGYGRVG